MRTITASLVVLIGATSAAAHPPFGYSPPWGGFNGYGYTRVTSFGLYGVSPYYGWAPTIVVAPPPIIIVAQDPTREVARLINRLPLFPPDEVDLLRRAPLPKEPVPKRNVAAKAPALAAPAPAANKADEAQRQLQLGKDALAASEPGRAEERFRRARELAPNSPMAHFLLAQALYTLGRYREAVVSIHDGLKLKPDWPAAAFNVRDHYGNHAADFALDLERLRQAAERNADELALTFLYGYQLWFNGRKKEARPFFERAAAQATDPKPIRLFLDLPNGDMP